MGQAQDWCNNNISHTIHDNVVLCKLCCFIIRFPEKLPPPPFIQCLVHSRAVFVYVSVLQYSWRSEKGEKVHIRRKLGRSLTFELYALTGSVCFCPAFICMCFHRNNKENQSEFNFLSNWKRNLKMFYY